MSLRAHLFLLLFSVAIGGAALTFANDRWHANLEVHHRAIDRESLALEKLRHISASFSRFLVTYDLVVFSGITYLGQDALLQLDRLAKSLDQLPGFEENSGSTREINNRLSQARNLLSGIVTGSRTALRKNETDDAEEDLAWVVEKLDFLIMRTVDRFDSDQRELVRNEELQEATQAASWIAYAAFLFVLVVWSSRRLAGPVDSLAELVEYEVGAEIPSYEQASGPTEFRKISSRVRRLILSLEETVKERTAALAGQVADHRNTQISLEAANSELERSVEELHKTQLALVQKERLTALGEMVGGISHDFNNVLVPITSYCSILLDQPDLDESEREELLTIVKTAAEDAARIVERLQAFTRSADASKNSEVIEIDEVVEDAVAMAEPRWKVRDDPSQRTINVISDLGGVGSTVGNAPEIRQALINLIFNAVDALPNGGEIRVSSRVEGAFIGLEVADNGTGMSEETLQNCQKPFFSTKEEKGTGLGLSMANNTALAHSGRLEIHSTLGSGTSVRISLARKTLTSRLSDAHDRNRKLNADLRILVVDDDKAVLNAHGAMLRQMGYDPRTTCNPLEALEWVNAEAFDVVITDLRMPELSGVELAKKVRESQPGIRILLLTGFEGGLAEYPDLSFIDQIMRKPIRKADLLEAVFELSVDG